MPVSRHPRRLRATLAAAASLGLAAAATSGVTPAFAVPSDAHILAGRAAATWLVTQLVDNHLTTFGNPDWGLTIDGLLALKATGADPGAATRVRDEVAAHAGEFITPVWAPDTRDAGSTAKLFVAAVSTGSDPTGFGGIDLRAATLAMVRPSGIHAGRVSDVFPDDGDPANDYTADQSNTFDQSLAVIGLARSGGVPQPVVDFLLDQQCAAGGFRLDPDIAGGPFPAPEVPTESCDADPDAVLDTDSTAMAVQALLAAADAGAAGAAVAATKGAVWLADQQRPDGGFGGSGPTAGVVNSDSTGLSGQALAAAGNTIRADKAATWIAGIQRTSAPDAGAIAYDPATFAAGPIEDVARDQWVRATAQALLALTQIPLGLIGEVDPPTPTASPSTPTTPGPSSSGPGGNAGLPITGAPTATIATVAMALIAVGVLLVLLARRRRSQT